MPAPPSRDRLPNYVLRVLDRLQGVRETPDGWVARCPCPTHGGDGEDHTASLRLTSGSDGSLLIICRVGCSTSDVLGSLGLQWRDLYADEGEEPLEALTRHQDSSLSSEELDLRDSVYTSLLLGLTLSEEHRQNLRDRGLSDDQIDAGLFRTFPSREEFAALWYVLYESYHDVLLSIPGFQDVYPFTPVDAFGGLVIPVLSRNPVRVQALKIRREGTPKYIYFSGGNTSCGVPVHVPPTSEGQCWENSSTVLVTEGELKAAVVSQFQNLPCLGIAGVSNWRHALPILSELQARQVVVAFDCQDVRTKPPVLQQLRLFVDFLRVQGYSVELLVWDSLCVEYKGLDDLLAANHQPTRLTAAEVDVWLMEVCTQLGVSNYHAPAVVTSGSVLSVESEELPEFPLAAFPEPVRQFCEQIALAKQCPVDFGAVGCLVVAGSMIGASRDLHISNNWYEQPTFYSVIVADPGSRKTPALRIVMQPVQEAQALAAEDYKRRRRAHAIAAEAHKHQCRTAHRSGALPGEAPQLDPMRHLYVGDTTVEALACILEQCPRGVLVFRDELTAWVRGMDQYKGGRGTDRQFYLSGWSGEPVKVDRKSVVDNPLFIERPYLSVLGSIQPDMIRELEDKAGRDDGFLHRILFSFPRPYPPQHWGNGVEIDEQPWRNLINNLLSLPAPDDSNLASSHYELTPAAYEGWVEWYNSHVDETAAEDFPRVLQGPWAKMIAYQARFALVTRMMREACISADFGNQIEAEDIQSATMITNYFKAHAKRVYRDIKTCDDDREVSLLLSWLLSRPARTACMRDISRKFHLTKSQTTKLVHKAVDRGVGTVFSVPATNNKTVEYFRYDPEGL